MILRDPNVGPLPNGELPIEATHHAEDASFIAGNRVTAFIPVDLQTGDPLYLWCLCLTATDFPIQLNLLQGYSFPDFPLDGQLSAMEQSTREAMFQNVAAFDLTGAGNHIQVPAYDGAMSYSQFLNAIGQQFEPAFVAANVTVGAGGLV